MGDGVADDTVAIQTAVDRGDPVVRLPARTYKITAPFRLRSSLTLVGDGMASTAINQTGAGAHGLVGADGNSWSSET
ncbi:glycoside hydrolase family 55 protein [Kitasatospora sp. DSM 101779]|nr:glycoside hydrolase family 55 protein [Kitasatospora sp. DSM 101779]